MTKKQIINELCVIYDYIKEEKPKKMTSELINKLI